MPTISGVGNKSNISFSNKNIYKATNNFINQKIQQFTDAFSRKNDYETIDYNAQNVTENTTQTKDRSFVSTYLQTRATFTLSTVSGILSVGEDIVDGATIVLGGLTSKIVGIFDDEKAKSIENNISEIVKEDYVDRLYDATVTTLGIDGDIAYGKTHTAGNIVGNIAGYAAITLATGGVATVAISGLAAVGNTAETALNSGATFNQTLAVSAVAGAIGALSGGTLDKIGKMGAEKILIQKVVNPKTLVKYIAGGSLVSMSEPVVNKVAEYLTYGKNLSDNFFDYFKETGGITNTLIAGAVGSLSVAGNAYKGYNELSSIKSKKYDRSLFKRYDDYQDFVSHYKRKITSWEKNLDEHQLKLFKNYTNEGIKKPGNYVVNNLVRGKFIDESNRTVSILTTTMQEPRILTFDEFANAYLYEPIEYKGNMITTFDEFIDMQYDCFDELNNLINSMALDEDTILYRGVNFNALESLTDVNGKNLGIVKSDSLEEIFNKLILAGGEYTDKGLMSSSPVPVGVTLDKDIIFEMACKSGTKGVDLHSVGGFENEFLLSANSKFDVVGFEEKEIKGQLKKVIYLDSK